MRTTLYEDDVVFMYAEKDPAKLGVYSEYGATALGWGGTHTHAKVQKMRDMGIHATGTMWCLTAKEKELHEDADLREAVVRDIAGGLVVVPWLFDFQYEGTPVWWGCTNSPAFRAHMRKKVCEAMAGDADGFHIDDHLGTAAAVELVGGCFCEWCMGLFRQHLVENCKAEWLAAAAVEGFEDFDYRALVRKYGVTREQVQANKAQIPLWQEYEDWQLRAAAENVRQLISLAREIVGRPIPVSANACLPKLNHTVDAPYLSYLVGEVPHYAEAGTARLLETVAAYRMAEAIGKPMAATACGWDWAHIAQHQAVNLVRVWIALAYACGQRLMVPHHIWCFNEERGSHWYESSPSDYAALYQFIRAHSRLFRDFRTVGPLAPPADVPSSFETFERREQLRVALEKGQPRPMVAGEQVWVFPRRKVGAEGGVTHLVNVGYEAAGDRVVAARDVRVAVPETLVGGGIRRVVVHGFDQEAMELPVVREGEGWIVRVPEVRIWAVVEWSCESS